MTDDDAELEVDPIHVRDWADVEFVAADEHGMRVGDLQADQLGLTEEATLAISVDGVEVAVLQHFPEEVLAEAEDGEVEHGR